MQNLIGHFADQMTSNHVPVAAIDQGGFGPPTDVDRQRTAGMKGAAGRWVGRIGYAALENDTLLPVLEIQARSGREERPGVGVLRGVKDALRGVQLDNPAEVHDGNAIADVLDDAQIVGDKHVGEFQLALQLLEQVDDLSLHRDIEGRSGLVEDDEPGIEGEGAGNGNALQLPAAKLVRIAIEDLARHAGLLQELARPGDERIPAQRRMRAEGFGDGIEDAEPRVERIVRALKDHLHVAPLAAHLALTQRGDVPSLEDDLTGSRLDQAQDDPAERRLATARFTDNTQCLSLAD